MYNAYEMYERKFRMGNLRCEISPTYIIGAFKGSCVRSFAFSLEKTQVKISKCNFYFNIDRDSSSLLLQHNYRAYLEVASKQEK